MGEETRITKRKITPLILCALLLFFIETPVQSSIILTTEKKAELAELKFRDGDLPNYDPETDTATLFFSEDVFAANEDIDAVHVRENGNIILSTRGKATIGGLTFRDGDLIEYNPATNKAVLFFDEDLFKKDEDIDAVHVLANDNIILSTTSKAKLGGLTFKKGDLVEYNPTEDTATLFFGMSLFQDGSANIDGVYVFNDGTILLTTTSTESLGGIQFTDGDIVRYNPQTGTSLLFFDEDNFAGKADIDGIVYYIPGPGYFTLAATALVSIACYSALRRRPSRGDD